MLWFKYAPTKSTTEIRVCLLKIYPFSLTHDLFWLCRCWWFVKKLLGNTENQNTNFSFRNNILELIHNTTRIGIWNHNLIFLKILVVKYFVPSEKAVAAAVIRIENQGFVDNSDEEVCKEGGDLFPQQHRQWRRSFFSSTTPINQGNGDFFSLINTPTIILIKINYNLRNRNMRWIIIHPLNQKAWSSGQVIVIAPSTAQTLATSFVDIRAHFLQMFESKIFSWFN